MTSKPKNAVMIFIKNPVLGRVKTRLARTTSHGFALNLYHQLLSGIRTKLLELEDTRKFLFYEQYLPCVDQWPDEEFIKIRQKGNRLHEKVQNAFSIAFDTDCRKALWIVPDCPSLKNYHLRFAFECLEKNDVVMGPTFDGGLYLLGMKEPYNKLLEHKEWGKGKLYRDLKNDCQKLGLSCYSLEKLQDIDREEDIPRKKSIL